MADAAVGKDKCGEQRLVSLPLSRIRVIMKSSPEVSSINQEALVLTAKATELFVQYLATCSYRNGSGKAKKALTYSDLASAAQDSETLQFLAVERTGAASHKGQESPGLMALLRLWVQQHIPLSFVLNLQEDLERAMSAV
ncbi:hypothetical protein STEG23_003808 [Scotinomys teguina]